MLYLGTTQTLMEIHSYLFVVPRYFLDAHGDTFLFVVVPRYFLTLMEMYFYLVVVPRYMHVLSALGKELNFRMCFCVLEKKIEYR